MRKLFWIFLLGTAFGQQFNQDIVPASPGLQLGHMNQRWNANLQNLNIIGTCTITINGVPVPCFVGVSLTGNNVFTGQLNTFNQVDFQTTPKTVLTLPPASQNTGRIYRVTDGVTTADCTQGGAGSTSLCLSNGSAWQPISISLSGGALVLPINLAFPNEPVGQGSPTQQATITNSSANTSVTISSIVPSTGYLISANNCVTTLAPLASCTMNVQFLPTIVGAQNGTVTVTSNGVGSPQVINTSGTGLANPVTLTSISLFPTNFTLNVGNQQQVTATCTYSDSHQANCTNIVNWISSNTAVFTVTSGGLVTAVGAGGPIAITANGAFNTNNGGAGTQTSSSTTVSFSMPSPQSSGDTNIVVVGYDAASGSITGVADTIGNSYSQIGSSTQGNGETQGIFAANAITACGTANCNTVTATFSAAQTTGDIRVSEFSGFPSGTVASITDTSNGANGNSTTASVATTTTNAIDMLVAGCMVANPVTAVGGGFTQDFISAGGNNYMEQEVGATGTYTPTCTLPTGNWAINVASLKPVSITTNVTVTATNPTVQHYVDQANGNDANDGTQPNQGAGTIGPWKTISHADAQICTNGVGTHGDTVNVDCNATLNSCSNGNCTTANAFIQLNGCSSDNGGTSAKPLIIQATPNNCALPAKITFASGLNSTGIDITTHYTTWKGFEMTGAVDTVIQADGDKTQILYNNIHDFNPSTPCPATGAILQGTHYDVVGADFAGSHGYSTHGDLGFTVQGNIINHTGSPNFSNSCSDYESIYAKFPHSNIWDNQVSNNPKAWGIQLCGYSCYDDVANNTVFNVGAGGIIWSHCTNWANLSKASNQCPSPLPEQHVTIVNNITINTKKSSGIFGGGSGITIAGGCAGGNNTYGGPSVTLIGYGLAYSNPGGAFTDACGGGGTGNSAVNMQTDSGGTSATFIQYQDNGNGNYKLKNGSNAIKNGTTTCADVQTGCVPLSDILQITFGNPQDIGAYKF